MSVRVALACSIAVLAACKSTSAPVADPSEVPVAEVKPAPSGSATSEPAPLPAAAATAPTMATSAEPAVLGPHPGLGERPVARGPGVEQLGTTCEASGAGCGRGNKLAVVRQSFWSSVPGRDAKLPCSVQSMTKGPPVTTAISACIADGLLVVQSRCVVCRVDSRELMVGRLADMLPAQMKEAQTFAQLDREPALTTEAAWAAAIAKAVSAARQMP